MLIKPYGNALIELPKAIVSKHELATLTHIVLTEEQICDLELLAIGAFSPLDTFMSFKDYLSVCQFMLLDNGIVWPIPINLSVTKETSFTDKIILCDLYNTPLATLEINEVYLPLGNENELVFGSGHHPKAKNLNVKYLSGKLEIIQLPQHYNFNEFRLSPKQVRSGLEVFGNPNVVAFQTRNKLHKAHEYIINEAQKRTNGIALIQPTVGITKGNDVPYPERMLNYKAVITNYKNALFSVIPLAMRFAGPRSALWHAIIRRNYGANHFIVGRDHAGMDGIYQSYEAQKLIEKYQNKIGIKSVSIGEIGYCKQSKSYRPISKIKKENLVKVSGTKEREKMVKGYCVWLTGLPSAGKTTLARMLQGYLQECGKTVTLLDGDIVRKNLSKGLGFSKEDRDTNVRRIGFVASEIVKHGGIVICSCISPYRKTRDYVRSLFPQASFIEVFVDCSIAECKKRDVKGLYERGKLGIINNVTGMGGKYEQPIQPEIYLNTEFDSLEECFRELIRGILCN